MAHDKVTDARLDAIAKFATNPDVVTRIHTANALGVVGSKAKTHVKFLIQMLQDKDIDVFVAACTALANMGEPGETAVTSLKKIAESKDETDSHRKQYAQLALDGIAYYVKNKDKVDKKDDAKDVKKDK
jgi:HEAT repeat protein